MSTRHGLIIFASFSAPNINVLKSRAYYHQNRSLVWTQIFSIKRCANLEFHTKMRSIFVLFLLVVQVRAIIEWAFAQPRATYGIAVNAQIGTPGKFVCSKNVTILYFRTASLHCSNLLQLLSRAYFGRNNIYHKRI
jgi:hypothetical protein